MLDGGLIEKIVRAVVGLQQRLDALAQCRIFGTGLIQVGGPIGGRGLLQRGQENGFDRLRVNPHDTSWASVHSAMRRSTGMRLTESPVLGQFGVIENKLTRSVSEG